MSIPTYDKFIDPMLRYLANQPEGAPASVVYEAVANALGIDENDKRELLPSKTQPVYKNRAGWAHDRLSAQGFRVLRGVVIGNLPKLAWLIRSLIHNHSMITKSDN